MTWVLIMKKPVHLYAEKIISKKYLGPIILENQFKGNLELFWNKVLLVSILNIRGGIQCGVS